VAVDVVELLEVVEVEHDGGERGTGARRLRDHALERVLDCAGVRHPGQRVGRGLALGLGEVAQVGEDRARLCDRVADTCVVGLRERLVVTDEDRADDLAADE
jgi:hypothetical protein